MIAELGRNTPPSAGFEIYVESVLLNLSRRFMKEGDHKVIAEVRDMLKEHFARIKAEMSTLEKNTPSEWKMRIEKIYSDSPLGVKAEGTDRYRVDATTSSLTYGS